MGRGRGRAEVGVEGGGMAEGEGGGSGADIEGDERTVGSNRERAMRVLPRYTDPALSSVLDLTCSLTAYLDR